MSLSQILSLALFQGFFEFLPVSSSGHLLLLKHYLRLGSSDIFCDVVFHLGTLVPLLFLRSRFFSGKDCFGDQSFKLLFWGLCPTLLLGFLFSSFDFLWTSTRFLPVMFFINGCVLFAGHFALKRGYCEGLTWKKSFLIGVAQSFSVFPGLSRSGCTLCTALLLKISPQKALVYSILLSIPTTLCAFLYELFLHQKTLFLHNFATLLAGFLLSMFVAFLSVRLLFLTVKGKGLSLFAIYSFLIVFCCIIF